LRVERAAKESVPVRDGEDVRGHLQRRTHHEERRRRHSRSAVLGSVGVQVHGVTGDGVAAGVWEDWETGALEERGPFHLDLATGILVDKWGIF